MAKIDIDTVRKVLQRNDVDMETISQVLEDLEIELGGNENEAAPAMPIQKKQYVMLISDPEGRFSGDLFTGWVLQIPEDQSPLEVTAQLIRSAYEYNQSKRGQREPVKTIADVCEIVPAKFLKAQNVWVKTKEPILVVHTDNTVPLMENEKAHDRDDDI